MTIHTMAATLAAVRAKRPLIHCITNHVTAGLLANTLLALGAVPAMVEGLDEVAGFVARADALVVNLGTLTPRRAQVMRHAVRSARLAGVPWVLDPVAAGAIPTRASFAAELLREGARAIRGNASEIPALLGDARAASGRGPDASAGMEEALPCAHSLARSSGAVVAVTGAVDWVLDVNRSVAVHSGHAMMTRVSGIGCAATALVAACLTVQPDPLLATAHALGLLGIAGGQAAESSSGPGSFVPAFLDALAALDAGMLPDSVLQSSER